MTKTMHTNLIVKMKITHLLFKIFQFLQSKLNSLTEKPKHQYYVHSSKKLLDPATSPKRTDLY